MCYISTIVENRPTVVTRPSREWDSEIWCKECIFQWQGYAQCTSAHFGGITARHSQSCCVSSSLWMKVQHEHERLPVLHSTLDILSKSSSIGCSLLAGYHCFVKHPTILSTPSNTRCSMLHDKAWLAATPVGKPHVEFKWKRENIEILFVFGTGYA